jgi:hypothetical protein
MEIVKRLKDKVSDSLIRECLPEEYKKGYRRENAKKQKKRKKKTEAEINLAPVVVLNPQKDKEVGEEEEKQKKENQKVVVIGADGMTYTQREEDITSSTLFNDLSISKDKVFNQTTGLQERKEQHSEKPCQFEIIIAADKMDSKEINTSSESSEDSNKDFLPFEFRLSCRNVQSHLDSIKSNTDDYMWFNGTIDLKTGVVFSAKIGRQHNVVEKNSSRNNNDLL